MTKEELVAAVERAHALWNQHGFTPRDLKAIHEAWWDLLGECEFEAVMGVLKERALREGPPPRPGELYRLVRAAENAENGAPSAAEAWAALRESFLAWQSGVSPNVPLHPAIRETASRLGGFTSAGMYTNRDRDLFMQEYGDVLAGWSPDSLGDH